MCTFNQHHLQIRWNLWSLCLVLWSICSHQFWLTIICRTTFNIRVTTSSFFSLSTGSLCRASAMIFTISGRLLLFSPSINLPLYVVQHSTSVWQLPLSSLYLQRPCVEPRLWSSLSVAGYFCSHPVSTYHCMSYNIQHPCDNFLFLPFIYSVPV